MATDLKDLSLDELLAADPPPPAEPVDVPEWGGRVYVRQLGVRERGRLEIDCIKRYGDEWDMADWSVRVVAAALCRADGRPLAPAGDLHRLAESLAAKSREPFLRVYEAAARLNHLERGAVEEKKESSGPAPAAASS